MTTRLPEFVIAGAPRSGTTSLARYLGAHPSLFIAKGKELRFFDRHYSKGIEWYASNFAAAPSEVLCGEASPWYMFSPLALRRMATHIPDARIIVSFREPTDRLWSHYWMRRERGLETRPFDEVIQSEFQILEQEGELSTDLQYLRGSLYSPHLKVLLNHFPAENVQVVILEQMAASPERTFVSLCQWLGVDDAFRPANLGNNVNAYVQIRSIWLRQIGKAANSRLISRIIGRINSRSGSNYPDISPEHRSQLTEFFQPYISELETLLGIAIPEWRAHRS